MKSQGLKKTLREALLAEFKMLNIRIEGKVSHLTLKSPDVSYRLNTNFMYITQPPLRVVNSMLNDFGLPFLFDTKGCKKQLGWKP